MQSSLTLSLILSFLALSQGFHFHSNLVSKTSLKMSVTPTPATGAPAKLQKIEQLKINSNYLRDPLKDELENDQVFLGQDAVVVMKYHGSYMQDNRDKRQRGVDKDYSFMLRLKSPAGEIPADLYLLLDDLANNYGQGDLRATTRQAWQLHGIVKGNLKTVISTIMKAGSSAVGACGDVSRNVMCTPAPFVSPDYKFARQYSKIFAELFKPQTTAFTELWLGEEKVAEMEYWLKDLYNEGIDVNKAMLKDNGNGIITKDSVEPLYGNRYLPKKFKVAITVPGDNSLDIYTNDIGLVVITNDKGELEGFNVMVGGGMGRTHNKDSTFARVADHLGFVSKDDALELCKSILATQRDHGNRDVRANARMKYLVHTQGIDNFRKLVEGYFGKSIQPWREIQEFKYQDWMGWHEQGDGNLFLGINIEQGRVKDYEESQYGTLKNVKVKSALKEIVSKYKLPMVLTPSQSVIFKDIKPEIKEEINQILAKYSIKPIEEVDSIVRNSMACPSLPLCGLAITEAERRMPEFLDKVKALLKKNNIEEDDIIIRMTGCPNGCARPYMAELALVGDGPDSYQVWLGGNQALNQLAQVFANRVKYVDIEKTLEPLFIKWKTTKQPGEGFGAFCSRIGVANLK